MKFLNLHSFSNEDLTVVQREDRDGRSLALACVYMPNPHGNMVNKLTEYAKRRGIYVVLCCDANAHHCQWGSADINKRGESVFNFITTNNLFICNKGNMPTFRTKDREAVIDITLTNFRSDYVLNWRVDSKCSFGIIVGYPLI